MFGKHWDEQTKKRNSESNIGNNLVTNIGITGRKIQNM